MSAAANSNFVGRLVKRLARGSCLIDAATDQTIPPNDLPELIARYGAALLGAGLQKGDRLLIGCSLSLSNILVYLGAVYAGLVAVPVEDRAVRDSLPTLLETTGARAVWTETATLRERLPSATSIRYLNGNLSRGLSGIEPAACSGSDLAALMPTSGSTGVPRFVMVSHGNLIANTEAIIRSQRLAGDERAMLILPLSYCFGASLVHTHLWMGGGVVLDRRFMFPDKVLHAVVQFACTTFAGVPTVYNVLLQRSNIKQISMPRLRRFLQAGGALAPQKISEMRAAFPQAEFYVMYGQTEATARISCMEPERWEEKRGSVGRPLDNLMVRIVDEEGSDLSSGRVGELLVKGPSICAGYWSSPEETSRVFEDGWLRTGDLARRDEEGYLWIEGRKTAFLKMRGIRVSFSEVEARVSAFPGIYECAARASTHQEAGEALVLYVVPVQGANINIEELRRRLPAHWAIDSIRLLPELPKSAAGKVTLSSLHV